MVRWNWSWAAGVLVALTACGGEDNAAGGASTQPNAGQTTLPTEDGEEEATGAEDAGSPNAQGTTGKGTTRPQSGSSAPSGSEPGTEEGPGDLDAGGPEPTDSDAEVVEITVDGEDGPGTYCPPPVQTSQFPACTQDEVDGYTSCLNDACSDTNITCFGPNYQKGKFKGPCAGYLSCTSACDCGDETCIAACRPSSVCLTCLSSTAACGAGCFEALSCARPADGGQPVDAGIPTPAVDAGNPLDITGDLGLDSTKSCDDLLNCCEKLTGPEQSACSALHAQAATMGSSGQLACSSAFSRLCK
jgi:hypothetical protein